MPKFLIRRNASVWILALGLFLVADMSKVSAQYFWNANSGDWSVPTNWASNTVPTNGAYVQIQNGGTATITTVVPSVMTTEINFNSTLVVSGGSLTSQIFTGRFQAGGAVVISNGGMLTNNLAPNFIDIVDPGTSVLVTGNNSTWNSNNVVLRGSLDIHDNGSVHNTGDLATLGNSSITVQGGGNLVATGNIYDTFGNITIGGIGTTGGTLAASSLSLSGNLYLNQTDTFNLAMPISAAGVLYQNGLGLTTLSGANTYQGGTFINAGTLVAASSTALGTGTVISTAARFGRIISITLSQLVIILCKAEEHS